MEALRSKFGVVMLSLIPICPLSQSGEIYKLDTSLQQYQTIPINYETRIIKTMTE